jgi:hypothetical protein
LFAPWRTGAGMTGMPACDDDCRRRYSSRCPPRRWQDAPTRARCVPGAYTGSAVAGAGAYGRSHASVAQVAIPPHRYTPLRENWEDIYTPLVEQLGLQVHGLSTYSPRGESSFCVEVGLLCCWRARAILQCSATGVAG